MHRRRHSRCGRATRLSAHGFVALFSSVVAACGVHTSSGDPSESYTRREAVVAECMEERGLQYTSPPYFSLYEERSEVETQVFHVADAERIGYQGTILGVALAFLEITTSSVPPDQAEEFDAALLTPGSGCRAAALAAHPLNATEQALADELERIEQRVEDLRQNEDFSAMSERWATCMTQAGITPDSADPFDFAAETRQEFLSESHDVMESVTGVDGFGSRSLERDRILDFVDDDAELADLLDEERRRAGADKACRKNHLRFDEF